jgi:hypothetical protein
MKGAETTDDRTEMWNYVLGTGAYINEQFQEWYALKTHQPLPNRSVLESVIGVDPGSPLQQQRTAANTTLLIVGALVVFAIVMLRR